LEECLVSGPEHNLTLKWPMGQGKLTVVLITALNIF
jgi:hypothetical protein